MTVCGPAAHSLIELSLRADLWLKICRQGLQGCGARLFPDVLGRCTPACATGGHVAHCQAAPGSARSAGVSSLEVLLYSRWTGYQHPRLAITSGSWRWPAWLKALLCNYFCAWFCLCGVGLPLYGKWLLIHWLPLLPTRAAVQRHALAALGICFSA